MFTRLVHTYATRALFTLMVLAILTLSLAAPVSAAEANNTAPATKPTLTFSDIKPDQSVTVEGRNLPANTTFLVRTGPFYTFFRDYVTLPSVKSDANGVVKFSVTMPSAVKGFQWVTVRLDGGGTAAFNAFVNVKGGKGAPTAVPTTPGGATVTPVPATGKCTIVSVTPATVTTRLDFDAIWTVKNTSGETWDMNSVDYKYVSGTKMQKRNDVYDMTTSVKSGETVKIVVDMLGPSTAGKYSTTWALVQGSKTLCSLPVTLRVK